jgi:hypothetical protein
MHYDSYRAVRFATRPSKNRENSGEVGSSVTKVEENKLESSGVQKLFDLSLHPAWDYYDVGPDGGIYIPRYIGRQSSPLTMLLNWRPSGD